MVNVRVSPCWVLLFASVDAFPFSFRRSLMILTQNVFEHSENALGRISFTSDPLLACATIRASVRDSAMPMSKKPLAGIQRNLTDTEPKMDRFERLFQQRLSELRDFRAEHGHGSIPSRYPENPSLGVWAANLRRQHVLWTEADRRYQMMIEGQKNMDEATNIPHPYDGYLTKKRRQQLLQAGFDFTSLTERQFLCRLEELKTFKKQYGHVLVPEKYEENLALGAWVSNLRSLYKRKKQEDSKNNPSGNIEVELSESKTRRRKPMNILQQSRSHYPPRRKKNRSPRFSHLDDERIKVLEDLGFVWSSIDRKWFEMLEWGKVFAVVNYHLNLGADLSACNENWKDDDEPLDAASDGNGCVAALDKSDGIHSQFDIGDGFKNATKALLLKNYNIFVQNLQDQTILTYFHPQEQVLDLLLDENYAQSSLKYQVGWNEMSSSKNQSSDLTHLQSQPELDFRILPDDEFHKPLRIWFANQRTNYNRRQQPEHSPSPIPSTMTDKRQSALEEINFPWSGKFRNHYEELKYEMELKEEMEQQREKELRREQREKEEREKVESLVPSAASGSRVVEEEEDDIMDLWNAEDDEDW